MKDLRNHPCFNEKAHFAYGRVHLPVAPKCNIQCNFCNRQYDCANENRPGVTSVILSPHQALSYLDKVLANNKKISVAGIAGPGDPFANPQETCLTLRLLRQRYPEILLCVATNGFNLLPYVGLLTEVKVSHVSITINAVDPQIGEKIYAWLREGKNIYRGKEASTLLLERQLEAIKALKAQGITVKINSIIIPGVNVSHIREIARKVSECGADIINPIPLYAVKETAFEDVEEISGETLSGIRKEAAEFLAVMSHCSRCRADAVGLLGEKLDSAAISLLQSCAGLALNPQENRPFVAVASREGILINQHLGEATEVWVYKKTNGEFKFLEKRPAPAAGGGVRRWLELADRLTDCSAILVSNAGDSPREVLGLKGIRVIETEGIIEDALDAISCGAELDDLQKKSSAGCDWGCSGNRQGC